MVLTLTRWILARIACDRNGRPGTNQCAETFSKRLRHAAKVPNRGAKANNKAMRLKTRTVAPVTGAG